VAGEDLAVEPAEVIAGVDEVIFQPGEEFGVRGWIGGVEVIRWFDQAAVKVGCPDAIDEAMGVGLMVVCFQRSHIKQRNTHSLPVRNSVDTGSSRRWRENSNSVRKSAGSHGFTFPRSPRAARISAVAGCIPDYRAMT
jgi:hypothetical protein